MDVIPDQKPPQPVMGFLSRVFSSPWTLLVAVVVASILKFLENPGERIHMNVFALRISAVVINALAILWISRDKPQAPKTASLAILAFVFTAGIS
ncbi:MAG: hypothetical protein JST35_10185 [Armatimonadetes bacterium]|nr:hypothetical protein [Armatimonadota bacterium]